MLNFAFMLEVKKISFSYTDAITLKDISFSVAKGKNLAVIGESGCGKSTLLKLIYGLFDTDEGTIHWKKTRVLGPKFNLIPGMDVMKYLAQDFDLMPYITVAENVGKFLSNFYPDQKKVRIKELLALVEMTEFANIKAQYLSGGQMQRVAIARVLALEPEVLLLDEPFSHIDNFRKNSLRRKLFLYLKAKKITCIIATHDSKDILAFSDETLVLQKGKMLVNDTTIAVFENPKSTYVASLFDDVNEIPRHLFYAGDTTEDTFIAYPFQLKEAAVSNLRVEVIRSYFKGNGYRVESVYKGQWIYFDSLHSFKKGDLVMLSYKK